MPLRFFSPIGLMGMSQRISTPRSLRRGSCCSAARKVPSGVNWRGVDLVDGGVLAPVGMGEFDVRHGLIGIGLAPLPDKPVRRAAARIL